MKSALGAIGALAISWLAAGCGQASVATEIPAKDAAIQYQGRFEWLSNEGPLYELPGSAISLGFTGTSVRVKLRDFAGARDEYGEVRRNIYDVVVDGVPQRPLEPVEGEGVYLLAEGLSEGEHQVALTKRTETWIGEGQLLGFVLDPAARVYAVPRPDRRIEFIGDSIAAGLGVEGADENCDYSARLQNHSAAFPTLVAKTLGAEHVAVAASGIGVAINYEGTTDTTMPKIYKRALLRRVQSQWSFDWKPQAVVINLGTSDFTDRVPDQASFVKEYRSMMTQVREVYPNAFILAVTGPKLTDRWPVGAKAATLARQFTEEAVAAQKSAGDANVEVLVLPEDDGSRGYGCDFHPSKATHAVMSEQISSALKSRLGW